MIASQLRKFILLIGSFASLAVCADPASDSIFWQAVHDGKTIYVLGVTHNGYKDQYPIRKEIYESFLKSKVYVTESEIPYLSTNLVEDALLEKFKSTKDETLEKLVNEDRCRTLANNESFKANMETIFGKEASSRFMTASPRATIFSLYAQAPKIDNDRANELKVTESIEFNLARLGKVMGVRHEYLDPELWAAIDALSPTDKCFLAVGMASVHTAVGFDDDFGYKLMIQQRDMWVAGNSKALERLSLYWTDDFASKHGNAEHKWINARNQIMTEETLKISAKESRPIFLAVGAVHLSGEQGIIEQLRALGFIVKPL